jgi:hypothetical protein
MKHDKNIKDLPTEYQILIHILSDDSKNYLDNKQFKDLVPEKLVALAEKHRLTPIFYNYLLQHHHDFNEDLMEQIKKLTREHTLKSLNLQSQLLKICDEFNRNHISYMTIKGPQLSHFLYNDSSRRVCVDLDLLLQDKDQFLSASAILRKSGYIRTNYPENSSRIKQIIFNIGKHESVFINRSAGTVVDLHIRPVGNTLFSARLHRHFFSEKQPYDMNGIQVYIPSIAHYFIFLCHHGAVHGYASLHWLADISAFYRRYPLPPKELLNVSEVFRLKRHILLSLFILYKYCGITVSTDIINVCEKSRIIRKLCNGFRDNLTRERGHIRTLGGRIEKTIYRFRLADGFTGKLDVLLSIMLRYLYRFLMLIEFREQR